MSLQRQIVVWIGVVALAVYALVELSGVLMQFLAGITIAYLLDRWLPSSNVWGSTASAPPR